MAAGTVHEHDFRADDDDYELQYCEPCARFYSKSYFWDKHIRSIVHRSNTYVYYHSCIEQCKYIHGMYSNLRIKKHTYFSIKWQY